MHIAPHTPEDQATLDRLIRGERDAEQRDRYRVAYLAIRGEPTGVIQDKLGRSRGFVQRWAYAYRDGGVDAIAPAPRGGSEPRLPVSQSSALIERITAGPTDADGLACTLGGKDVQRILAEEFGVNYSLSAVYKLLHRHRLSCLRPRPEHRKADPQAQQQWLEDALFLSGVSASSANLRSKSKSGARTRPASGSRGH